MKEQFHGYYRPIEGEFRSLWENATIAFDANVILNLYRLSPNSLNEFLGLLQILKGRIWLTFQAAEEYQRNRCNKIAEQSPKYEQAREQVYKALSTLQEGKQQPWIENELHEEFRNAADKVIKALQSGKRKYDELLHSDPIRDRIGEIFDGRIGEPLNNEELDKAYKEAKLRYAKEIPPGYKDAKKPEPQRYGDYVIWKELMAVAVDCKGPLIFVTDEMKEDWWLKVDKKIVGPNPKLRQEFRSQTGQDIYLYSPDEFLDAARDHGHSEDVSPKTVEEVKESAVGRYNEAIAALTRPADLTKTDAEMVLRGMEAGAEFAGSDLDAIREKTVGPSPLTSGPIGKVTNPVENDTVGELMIYEGDPPKPLGATLPVINLTGVTLSPDWLIRAIRVGGFRDWVAHIIAPPPGYRWKGVVYSEDNKFPRTTPTAPDPLGENDDAS